MACAEESLGIDALITPLTELVPGKGVNCTSLKVLAPSHKSCGVFQVSVEGHWTYSWTDALVPQSLYVSLTWTAGILEICFSLRAKKKTIALA